MISMLTQIAIVIWFVRLEFMISKLKEEVRNEKEP